MDEFLENGSIDQISDAEWHARFGDPDIASRRDVGEPLSNADDVRARPRIRLRSVSQLDTSKRVAQLVKGVLTQGQPAMLHGRSQSAKSFVLADLSKAIAIGEPFFGRRVTSSCVLYVPFEGEGTFGTRMHAIADGMTPDEYELYDRRFAMMQDPQSFLPGEKGMRAAKEVIDNAKALEDRSGEPIGLIVLDTMFAALPGCSVNDDSVMTHALNLANEIAKATGAVPLFAHHPGHTNQHRMIGSSSAIGGFNTILRVQVQDTPDTIAIKSDEPRLLILDKWKDGQCDVVLGKFDLRVVAIGVDDEDGTPVTSCTINVIEIGPGSNDSAKRSRRPKLNTQESRCRDHLLRLYDQKKHLSVTGAEIGIPDAAAGDHWLVVKLPDLKHACRQAKLTVAPSDDTPAKEADREYQAFKRTIESLDTKRNLIGRYDDYVWDLEINRNRGRNDRSTRSTDPTDLIAVDPVDTDREISTDSTPSLEGVGLSITSGQKWRGRKEGSGQEEIEPPQPNREAITPCSSLPRKLKPPHERPGDHARSMGSTGAQADVGPVAPDSGDEIPATGRVEL